MNKEYKKRTGTFYTPKIWAAEAMKMIEETFGADCREKYIFWDPAAGTLNLTRDYQFKELYCSTLEQSDLDTAEQMGYNRGAVKFQYDFLNDGIVDGKIDVAGDPKLPKGLKDALLEGKEIIVFMNPPYGKSNGNFKGEKSIKSGIKKDMDNTNIKKMMEDEGGYDKSISQSYAQFLYRLIKLKDICNLKLCFYSPPLYLSGSSYKKLRLKLKNNFTFNNGHIFCASHFSDVSKVWGISFSIWSIGNTNSNDFNFNILDLDENFSIVSKGIKTIYNLDMSKKSSEWSKVKTQNTKEVPQFIGSINISERVGPKLSPNNIGYFNCGGNNINCNLSHVGLYTSSYSGGGTDGKGHSPGFEIIDKNFNKCLSLFTARKTIKTNWLIDKDEYMAPNESHPDYQQWNNDAIVYSLFNTSSNQSSMRQVQYKNKLWDIKNEFFWLSKDEMLNLADEHKFNELYQDAEFAQDRYVYNLLKDINLSPDAKEVLDMASDLLRKSFKMRILLHQEHPEWHLNTWDAGFYQIKLILKEYYKDDLKVFVAKYKAFEDRMREGVYKFGFLK